MFDKSPMDIYGHEWRSGVLLNPFYLVESLIEMDKAEKSRTGLFKKSNDTSQKEMVTACKAVAEIFLDCTDYLTDAPSNDLREGEYCLLSALITYLYFEAPPNEMNACMLNELIIAEYASNNYVTDTDCAKLFNMLEETKPSHPALKQFNEYKENKVSRKKIWESISRRFRPLFSFTNTSNKNIFSHCSRHEIFELAVTLLHNCSHRPEAPLSLMDKKSEVAFVTAALGYVMLRHSKEHQTAADFFDIIKAPTRFAANIEVAQKNHSQIARTEMDYVFEYWSVCSKDVLAEDYDKERVTAIADFYREFR